MSRVNTPRSADTKHGSCTNAHDSLPLKYSCLTHDCGGVFPSNTRKGAYTTQFEEGSIVMAKVILVLALLLGPMAVVRGASPAAQTTAGYDQAIEKYVRFLETQKQTPVDYLMGLFAKYDIVVLCERAHPETTQYDMICELACDKRFQQQVGHIFTECGSVSLRPAVEELLTSDQLSEEQTPQKLRAIYRNFNFQVVWDKTNSYDFLLKISQLNRTLPKESRVHIWPCDVESDWSKITKDNYGRIEQQLGQRDKIMADNLSAKFKEIQKSPGRQKKALVIMNYRHAFTHLRLEFRGQAKDIENMTGFLMAAYPGKVANVMINSTGLLVGQRGNPMGATAIQDGKWDAAFAVAGNPSRGFDFKGSPFGGDAFDYFPFPVPARYTYQDVFTGFVFYKPLGEHRMSFGVAGLLDPAFTEELVRRCQITGQTGSPEDLTKQVQQWVATVRISGYDDKEIFPKYDGTEKIQRWLKKAS